MTEGISRREFNEIMGLSAVALGLCGPSARASDNGDVGWTSDDPHLSGNYLPVEREIDADNLPVNDALNALPTRFVYLPTRTNTPRVDNPPSATFNTMLKVNTVTGDIVRHDFGNRVAGEAIFIPRRANGGEDDGYLAIFAFDPVNRTSDLVLLDAAHINAKPVAVIRLPQRVPQGLHGTWIPKA